MAKAIINGKAWNDVTINFLGIDQELIKHIKFNHDQDKKNIMGKGSKPVGRGRGNESFGSPSVSLLIEAVDLIIKANGDQPLVYVAPFTISVTYFDGAALIERFLYATEFTGHQEETIQGSTETWIECPLIVGDIGYA